ncbi:hypothetical protein, partial [Brunnivagina elsteri]
MTFQILEISESSKIELTVWADTVIAEAKQAMYLGEKYLLWNSPYYQKGVDAWVDETWWIQCAKEQFKRFHKSRNCDIIPALEILASHFPDEYGEIARTKIDEWYNNEGLHDPEYWWDLIEIVNCKHPVLDDLIEVSNDINEWLVLARCGYEKAINYVREYILESLFEKNLYRLNRLIKTSGSKLVKNIFSQYQLKQIEDTMMIWASQQFPLETDDSLYQLSILESAVIMDWQEVLDILSLNQNYLNNLFFYLKNWLATQQIFKLVLSQRNVPTNFTKVEF